LFCARGRTSQEGARIRFGTGEFRGLPMKRVKQYLHIVLVMTALALPAMWAPAYGEQIPLSPTAIPQFVDPLPGLAIADGTQPLTLTMCEFKANVLPTGTFAPGVAPETWVWGYSVGTECPSTTQSTYLGPVIVSRRGVPTEMTFINNLGYASASHVL